METGKEKLSSFYFWENSFFSPEVTSYPYFGFSTVLSQIENSLVTTISQHFGPVTGCRRSNIRLMLKWQSLIYPHGEVLLVDRMFNLLQPVMGHQTKMYKIWKLQDYFQFNKQRATYRTKTTFSFSCWKSYASTWMTS